VGDDVEVDARTSLVIRKLASLSLGPRRFAGVVQAALLTQVNVSDVFQNKRRVMRSGVGRRSAQLR
jgi:hypothetical protein